jgi:hypothetical protein
MSSTQIFKLVYIGVAIFGSYLLVARLFAGQWLSALIPLAAVALCVYRLLTMEDE